MKKLRSLLSCFLLASLLVIVSCDNDDDGPKGEFSSGVLVVNEGNFGSGDGTVTHYDPDNGEVKQDIFASANNSLALGDVVQSMTIDGDLAYIVVNNDNKVEVVNANTFVSEYTLEDRALPRYFITFEGKGYLTEWVATDWVNFSIPGRVAVIDLESYEVETTITTEAGAENIIAHNNKLYVSNSFANSVSVIDLPSQEVVETIEVGNSPGAFVVDKNNKLWVICGGSYGENNGMLYRINTTTNAVEEDIALNANVMSKMVINESKDLIYFCEGNNVYAISVTATEAPSAPLLTESNTVSFYGIGLDAETDIIYVSDAKSFAGNGMVYRYKQDGTALDNFTAGRGPNGFVFR